MTEQELGAGMQSSSQSEALQQLLAALPADDSLTVPAYNSIVDAGRLLITQVGNQSNLILDPDPDSYYTMSLVVLRFPELQDLLARTAQKSVELSFKGLAGRTLRRRGRSRPRQGAGMTWIKEGKPAFVYAACITSRRE